MIVNAPANEVAFDLAGFIPPMRLLSTSSQPISCHILNEEE